MYNNVVEAALEALWKLGFATVRFNFRGVGASEGEHSGGVGESDDAKAAMRFLLSQPGIAKDGAIMAGYSFGAAVAMRAGAETEGSRDDRRYRAAGWDGRFFLRRRKRKEDRPGGRRSR